MVATKSRKAKLTYAERPLNNGDLIGVLGAFSVLQKENRRRSVHLASLRAQVKKTAQARKDTLGPQWSSWVGKAVHKLEDGGLLEPSDAGSVAVTPNGKKAISAARRNLLISTHATPTPAQEEQIWKQVVAQGLAGRGLKRKHRSRVGEGDEDDEERQQGEEDQGVRSTPKSHNTRSKRARFSSVGAKAVSKMTKAELKAELRSLQQAHAQTVANLERSQQAETDEASTEEVDTLRDELKERQMEINAVRAELAEVRRLTIGGDETSTQPGGASSPGPIGFPTSSPIRSDPATPARIRPLTGVIRTQSGSHISHLSKQPTPAPSSPDHDGGDLNFGADNDAGVLGGVDDLDDLFNSPSGGNGGDMRNPGMLRSFEATPERGTKVLRLEEEVGRYKLLVEEVKKRADERDALSRDKLDSVEQALTSRIGELRSLENTLAALRNEHSECQLSISDRDTDITALQAEIKNLKQEVTSKDALISVKDTELLDLQHTKDTQVSELELANALLEKCFASKRVELESVIEGRNSSIKVLLSEKEKNLAQLSGFRRDSEATIQEHLARIEAADSRVSSLLSTATEMEAQLKTERASNAVLLQERLELEAENVKHKEGAVSFSKQIEAQNAHIAELEGNIEALKTSQSDMAGTLAQRTKENASLVEQLRVTETSNASLEKELARAIGEKSEANDALSEARESMDDLNVRLQAEMGALAASKSAASHLQTQLAQSQCDAQDLRNKISALDTSVESLRAMAESSKAVNEALKGELRAAVERGVGLDSLLEEKDREIKELAAWKDRAGADIASLQEEVVKATKLAVSLQEDVATATAQLTSSCMEVERLSVDLAAKDQQRESLAQMVSVSESAGDKLRAEVAEGKKEIQTLRVALESAENGVRGLQMTLDATRKDLQAKTADYDSTISVLRASLITAQSDADTFKGNLTTLVSTHSQVKAKLEQKHTELAQTRGALESAEGRLATLEQDMVGLSGRAQEAEAEVLDLRSAQEVDAATIESLKEGFTHLRKAQMQSLAELDNKVTSAQSSPIRKGRGPSKTPARMRA